MNRRHFVKRNGLICASALSAVGIVADPVSSFVSRPKKTKKKTKRKPRLDLAMVQEMVDVAHFRLDSVKKLVEKEPQLANACHDWGAGDFETALGAASHSGHREIALFLLQRGARMDIFAATMLGRLDIVQPTLTAFPEMINTKGPHGISLTKHAEVGKKQAARVLEYLKTLNK